MFTGIVEEVGRITRIEQRGENRRITIGAENTPSELKPATALRLAAFV